MTSVDLGKIQNSRITDEQLRLQFMVLYLKRHPFRNLWNWIMGRQ